MKCFVAVVPGCLSLSGWVLLRMCHLAAFNFMLTTELPVSRTASRTISKLANRKATRHGTQQIPNGALKVSVEVSSSFFTCNKY